MTTDAETRARKGRAQEPAAQEPAAQGPGVKGPGAPGLRAENVTLSYGSTPVVAGVSLEVPHGGLTVVVGPNGCGKSTLLKSFARVLKPEAGRITLHGTDIRTLRGKEFARQVALLPQSPLAPEGISVRGLVARGRHPHHTLLRQWSPGDDDAIARALDRAGMTELADSPAGALSGGQRQRAWIAMVLAQETDAILLDEPTTYLDIAHQYDLLELCAELNRAGRTIVAVLHDLNQAARFASHLVVMDEGRVVAEGPPERVLTAELVADVFRLAADIVPDPRTGTPMVIPHERAAARE